MLEKSHGEKLVGVGFNPSKMTSVDTIKSGYAKIIDEICEHKQTSVITQQDRAKQRMLEIAVEKALEAQMWAVKAITYGRD